MLKGFKKGHLFTASKVDNLPLVCTCLMGKFKAWTGERYLLLYFLTLLSQYYMHGGGLRSFESVWVLRENVRTSFCWAWWLICKPYKYNATFRKHLCKMQLDHPELFSPDEDVTRYGLSRSLLKTVTKRANQAGLGEAELDVMNQWQVKGNAKGSCPKHNMTNHYPGVHVKAQTPNTLRYAYVQ